jgi:serine/threonine-protein kinase
MVKLLDFGIAKLMRAQMKMEKTQTGNMLGTPRYISPEQARGIDVDHRSDIYSLGVIAYEMLAGRPPFQGETAMDLVVKHLSDPPPPLSQFARVPKLLEQCVMRMLEKDPSDRPSLAVVRQILTDPTKRFATLPKGFAGRRSSLPLILGGAVAAVALALVAWKLVGKEPSAPATTPPPVAAAAPAPVSRPPAPPEPAPVVAETLGTLAVTVTGAKRAVISVDGKEYGRGESVKAELAPGGHEIEVRAPGRDPIVQHVEISAGASNTVAIVVPATPARTGRPPKKPPTAGATKPSDDDGLMTPKRGGK